MRSRLPLILILVLFLLPAADSLAETTATIDGCTIKVTINIALVFENGISNQDQTNFINRIKNEAAKKWNDANITCGDCKCELELTVNVTTVDNCNDQAASGHHCVEVDNVAAGTFHRSTVTAGDFNGTTSITSGTGDWGINDSAGVIAHELGHLMGLEDEYQDVYFYFYKDAQNNVINPPGVQSVPVSDYTPQRAQQIAAGANPPPPPDPFSTEFMRNPSSNNLVWSWPKPGKDPNSIMVNFNGSPQGSHADNILDDANLDCPDECCCGDGEVNKGEQCDPKATPSGCPANNICMLNCVCVQVTPICGDGAITPPEECDPAATPAGCAPGKECVGCVCESQDTDGDGIPDDTDNCPEQANILQEDIDADFSPDCTYAGIIEGLPYYTFTHINGIEYMCGGDPCDYDDDNDEVTDYYDACPGTFYMPVDANGCPLP